MSISAVRWIAVCALVVSVGSIELVQHSGFACEGSCEGAWGDDAFWLGVIGLFIGVPTLVLGALVGLLTRPKPPVAAWYPDPDDPDGTYRYWNGLEWTEHRAPR